MSQLCGGRFLLGLGAGENLNEHVIGQGWPPVNVRHEMLREALVIIRRLADGGTVNYAGDYFRVDSARLFDPPPSRLPLGVAVSGNQGIRLFAPSADAMIAVAPEKELVAGFEQAGDALAGAQAEVMAALGADLEVGFEVGLEENLAALGTAHPEAFGAHGAFSRVVNDLVVFAFKPAHPSCMPSRVT